MSAALPKCPRCGKTVYPTEKELVDGVPYHKQCYSCYSCGRKFNLGGGEHRKVGGRLVCAHCDEKGYQQQKITENATHNYNPNDASKAQLKQEQAEREKRKSKGPTKVTTVKETTTEVKVGCVIC